MMRFLEAMTFHRTPVRMEAVLVLSGFLILLAETSDCRASSQQLQPLPDNPTTAEQRIERSLKVDGRERTYIAHIPASTNARKPLPVVLAFHPGLGTSEQFERVTNLHQAKFARDFIIVYPNGWWLSWNVGECCGRAKADNVDDVKFTREILRDLKTFAPIDEKRIYATGFSNGGKMAYRLACDMSDQITAIVPSGTSGVDPATCNPSRPVPILHFHGMKDQVAPFHGGESSLKGIGYQRPVAEIINFWIAKNDCKETRTITTSGNLQCTAYRGCRNNADITLCPIPEMAHQWPGDQPGPLLRKKLGPGTTRISGSEEALKFFKEDNAR